MKKYDANIMVTMNSRTGAFIIPVTVFFPYFFVKTKKGGGKWDCS